MIYPNPTNENFENTISFEIQEESSVKLELVDHLGVAIQLIAEGIHDKGSYKYPFTIKHKRFDAFKIIYYRLTVIDLSETKRIIVE